MSGRFGIFNPFQNWKKGDLPYDPTVTIILKEWGSNDGMITISMSLASDTEIDFSIDALKKDLETTRKEAKRQLKLQREKLIDSVGK